MSESRMFLEREPINNLLETQKNLAKRVQEMSNFTLTVLNGGRSSEEEQLMAMREEAAELGLDLSDEIRSCHESTEIVRNHLEEFGLKGELVEKFRPIAEKFRNCVADTEEPIASKVQATEEEIRIAEDFILRAENLLLHLTEVEAVERAKLIG